MTSLLQRLLAMFTPVPEIDAPSAKALLDEGTASVVDIRDGGSFSAGHIAGATHLDDAGLNAFLANADKERTLIVCCYHGNSSRSATAFLLKQGFKDVRSLSGGFEGWRLRFPFTNGG